MAKPRYYCLTDTAVHDFQEARAWSLQRWGKEQTRRYFRKRHDSAELLGEQSCKEADDDTPVELQVNTFPIGEHYIVYTPISKQYIAIVALIRQTRDVPTILQSNQFQIARALKALRKDTKR